MSKRSRNKPQRAATRKRRQRRPEREEHGLAEQVALALADAEPLAFLELASTLLAAIGPRPRSPFEPPEEAGPSRNEVVQSFLEADVPETSALLAAIAALSGDEMLRRRVGREIQARAHALPRWLADLGLAVPSARAVEVVHALGDGDNVIVGAVLPGGHEITAVIYIDHNLGTLVKDAFVLPAALDDLVVQMQVLADGPDTQTRDLDPADARVRITEAIELGAITFPPLETDTWPGCRPIVEWIAAMLPEGGSGYSRPDWDDAALAELSERFFTSADGAALDDPDHRGLLESVLWFGTAYGPGDPLRWSPTAVEILLADRIPRKIVAGVGYLAKAPDLLRAFVRFCHRERGIRAELTGETLAAVDEYEPAYQQVIRSPRPQGPAALIAALSGLVGPSDDDLRHAVGGADALDRLTADPLPDEPFVWDAIPPDIHDRVREVLVVVDDCAAELLGTEARTACRRLLARVAAADPEIFRRRSKASSTAAAVCWSVAHANALFAHGSTLRVKDVVAQCGSSSSTASQRSEVLLRAIGVEPQFGAVDLGSPDYLTSHRRATIIEQRDAQQSI